MEKLEDNKKSIPAAQCLHSTHVSCCNYFLFLYTFHRFLYEKKINMLFSFFFLYFVTWVVFSCTIHKSNFLSLLPLLPCVFCWKIRHLFKKKKYKKYPCQFCCFRTNASLKTRNNIKACSCFSLLMTWTVVDFDNNLCLVLVPYISFTFPKHGLHTREYTDAHSPEAAARIHDDAAATRCLQSASCIPLVAAFSTNGTTTDISQVAAAGVRGPNPSIGSHHSSHYRQKNERKKKNPLHSISILREPPSFETLLTNATAVMEVERRSALSHGDSHIISHMSNHASQTWFNVKII